MNVLVANAHGAVSLAVIRSLSRKGIEVTAVSNSKDNYPTKSKYCKKHRLYPENVRTNEDIIKALLNIVEERDYDVFLPILDEPILRLLSKNRAKFEKYVRLPIADFETFEKSNDKSFVMKKARELDIPCPKTYFINDLAKMDEIKDKLDFPLVIKPYRGFGARGIVYVNSYSELKDSFTKIQAKYGPSMIQEFIPTLDCKYSVNVLFNRDSKPRRFIVHRGIRQYPVSGGVYSFCESVKKKDLVEYTFRLLKDIRYFGIACIEFVLDERDGKPKLMEINPRFYGSLQLSIIAGVDYPYLLCKMAIDGDIEKNFEYKEGVRCRNLLWGDARHLIDVLKNRAGPNYPIGKLQTLINFLKFHEDRSYYILSIDDPMPALAKIKNSLFSVAK